MIAHGATNIGRVRTRNEDAFVVDVPNGIFLVADGIGGHPGGNIASDLTVKAVHALLRVKPPGEIKRTFELADKQVLAYGAEHSEYHGLGSTLVAVSFESPSPSNGNRLAWVASAGDSRVYLFRKGVGMKRLTTDHSRGSFLSNAIGMLEFVDLATHDLRPGDELLLCTDGLTNAVDESDIARELRGKPKRDVEALIQRALDAGGPDNVTATAVVV